MTNNTWLFGKNGALFQAASSGDLDCIKSLLDNGADVNTTSANGYTPLHRAAQNGHLETVKLLLSRGAIPAALSKNKETPTQLADANGYSNIVKILQIKPL